MKKLTTYLLALLASCSLAHAADKPTNVLLITADDLGYEVMDFLGGRPHALGFVSGVLPNANDFLELFDRGLAGFLDLHGLFDRELGVSVEPVPE